jgi:hypothetical protein
MANEIHFMRDSEDKKFGVQFRVGGQPYVIWMWMTDDTADDADRDADAYQVQVSPIVLKGNVYTNGSAVKTEDGTLVLQAINKWRVDNQFDGSVIKLYESFLEKVNKFIKENTKEDDVPADVAGFPVDGTITEQLIWLVQKGTKIENGEVKRK